MKKLECGSCTACCEWGDDKSIRPVLTTDEANELRHSYDVEDNLFRLESDANGKCVYLIDGGCSIYNYRPMQCKVFDCRVLYDQMKGKTFINVINIGWRKSHD